MWWLSFPHFTVPDAPRNFSAVAMFSTSVQLSWVIPDPTNGILLSYTVVYYNSTNSLLMVYSNDTFMDRITNLNEDTDYNFVIYGNTSAGAGPNATDLARTFEDCKSRSYSTVVQYIRVSWRFWFFWPQYHPKTSFVIPSWCLGSIG